jgi:hypothetical protein
MLVAAIAAPKISFDRFAMISFSASGKRCFVIVAQKIGLHRRKFHHTSLKIMQCCIASESPSRCSGALLYFCYTAPLSGVFGVSGLKGLTR